MSEKVSIYRSILEMRMKSFLELSLDSSLPLELQRYYMGHVIELQYILAYEEMTKDTRK